MENTVSDAASFMPWNAPDWNPAVHAWIRDTLDGLDIQVTGPVETVHLKTWSAVLRAPTTSGTVYFKATSPTFAHEPALTSALARLMPEQTPDVLGTDVEKGWLMMRDAGPALRAQATGDDLLDLWEEVLPHLAALQQLAAPQSEQLLALGVPDRRPGTLPSLFARLLDDPNALLVGQEDGLIEGDLQEAQRRLAEFDLLCAELAGSPVPHSIHHDDFHDGNVFSLGRGHVVFADWAESAVAHPFCTLTVGLRSMAYRANLPEHAPRIQRLTDRYLEPWTSHADLPTLRNTLFLARRAGRVMRALTWHTLVSSLPDEARHADAGSVPGWVEVYLEGERTSESQPAPAQP